MTVAKLFPAKPAIVLTARVGQNKDLFPDILRLYARPGDRIADVTYGKGNFWKSVDTSQYELLATDLATGVDFRSLPYADGSLRMVVLDPPYIYNPKDTVKASLSSPYRVNETGLGLTTTAAVVDLYKAGMREAMRVLGPGGRLVVKCQDQIESNKQRWVHVLLYDFACNELGMYARDLFVLVQTTQPTIRWPIQYHGRKNHSYFWIFEKTK